MKTIAVYNNKGGIGKTVTSVNLAYELTVRGYRVLLIDTDPQGNASSFYRRYDLTKASVTELLMGARPTRCKWRTRFKNLDIVSANSNLRTVDPGKLVAGVGTLRLALWVYENDYDYCIIDCPPGVGFLIEVVMDAVEDVIIPLNPDVFSTDGLGTTLDVIREFGDPRVHAGCLFTAFYKNRETVALVQSVMSTMDVMVYNNLIRRCGAVSHSLKVRKPLAKCASRSTAAEDYRDFTGEYLEREDKTWHCSRV